MEYSVEYMLWKYKFIFHDIQLIHIYTDIFPYCQISIDLSGKMKMYLPWWFDHKRPTKYLSTNFTPI